MGMAVFGGAEIQHELEPHAVLVGIAAEAIVGVLEPDVGVGVVSHVEGAADVGRGPPTAFPDLPASARLSSGRLFHLKDAD